jgi:murein DD-endopeptidase MepM/ murein hydrolase activator NlpD
MQSSVEQQQYDEVYEALLEKKDDLDRTPSIMPTTGWRTCGFGMRTDPFTGKRELHPAIDIANKVGTPVMATADGTVSFLGRRGHLGKTVVIDHGNGFETVYGHVDDFRIKEGDRVARGQVIAHMGNTGRSTGPHLHYGVVKDGVPVNPNKYIYTSDYLAAN